MILIASEETEKRNPVRLIFVNIIVGVSLGAAVARMVINVLEMLTADSGRSGMSEAYGRTSSRRAA